MRILIQWTFNGSSNFRCWLSSMEGLPCTRKVATTEREVKLNNVPKDHKAVEGMVGDDVSRPCSVWSISTVSVGEFFGVIGRNKNRCAKGRNESAM